MQILANKVFVYLARSDATGTSHEFLQLHRADDSTAAAWQTISGLVEEKEQAWQAALRSLKTIVGINPKQLYRTETIHSYYSPADDAIWHCPQFFASLEADDKIAHGPEFDEIRWVARKYIDTQFFLPSQRRTLAEICAEILDDGPARDFLRVALPSPGGGNGKHGK